MRIVTDETKQPHFKFVPNGKKKTMYDGITGEPYETDDADFVRVNFDEPGYDEAPLACVTFHNPEIFKHLL